MEKKPDVPILVAMVHKELRLDAASAPDGSKAIKRSGAVNIAVGVAELRNQGFGSGHGQASAPSGLGVRHARLTVNAAVTWCELILDTLADPSAPWHKASLIIAESCRTPIGASRTSQTTNRLTLRHLALSDLE
ncbi:abortive infection family protein (plasmid) [Streptomyces avidinii]|uniref:abortive infection family protein n=1 Tax=Streptomyces avidinii TaxID=1895 RepID=UPI002F9126F5|nr:abortive infection family protein [Streptomyces avidinii]